MPTPRVSSHATLPGFNRGAKSPALDYFAGAHIPRLVDTTGYESRRYGRAPSPVSAWVTLGGRPIPANACVPERMKLHTGPALPDMTPKQRAQYLERQWARLARAGKQCKYHAGLTRTEREEVTDA